MTTIAKSVVSFIPTTTEDILTNEVFRAPLLLHISSALSTLRQNGIGNNIDLFSTPDATWDDFFGEIGEDVNTASSKQYVYIKTQLLFDPPQPSAIQILEKAAEEALWRARLEFEQDGERITPLRSVGDEVGDSEVETVEFGKTSEAEGQKQEVRESERLDRDNNETSQERSDSETASSEEEKHHT